MAWMIECEGCREWFHGHCVGIDPNKLGPKVDCFLCEAPIPASIPPLKSPTPSLWGGLLSDPVAPRRPTLGLAALPSSWEGYGAPQRRTPLPLPGAVRSQPRSTPYTNTPHTPWCRRAPRSTVSRMTLLAASSPASRRLWHAGRCLPAGCGPAWAATKPSGGFSAHNGLPTKAASSPFRCGRPMRPHLTPRHAPLGSQDGSSRHGCGSPTCSFTFNLSAATTPICTRPMINDSAIWWQASRRRTRRRR